MEAEPPYELIYWPEIPGRAELIRLLFEASSTPFIDHSKSPDAITTLFSYLDPPGSPDPLDDSNPPVLAPPLLRHGSLVLSQTPSILLYLAPKLNLAPPESPATFHLHHLALTIMDFLLVELHATHHPVSVNLTYEQQMPAAKRTAAAFRTERIPKILEYLQRVLSTPPSGGQWLYGSEMTYVDLVFFQCFDGTLYAFPKTMEKLRASGLYEDVFALYDRVKSRPRIREYLASERRARYGNGIWRHYPELDDDGEGPGEQE